MSLTVTIASEFRGHKTGTVNLGTYATNGVAVSAADFNLEQLVDLAVQDAGGYTFEWDDANGKIIAYDEKDPAAAGGADIPAPEVANSTDLSAVDAHFNAFGY